MLFNASTFVAVLAGFSAVASAKHPAHHAPPPTGAALCRTPDVKENISAVKDNFSHAKAFCKWFVTPQGVRGGSPISDLNHAEFVQACGCITKQYDPNPKRIIPARDAPKDFNPACRVAAHDNLSSEIEQPQKFCRFYQNQVGFTKDVPFPNVDTSKQLLNACECVLHPKRHTKGPIPHPSTSASKTSTASKSSSTASTTATSSSSMITSSATSSSSSASITSSATSSSSASITAAPVTATTSSSSMDASAAATNTARGFAKRYHAAGNAAYRG